LPERDDELNGVDRQVVPDKLVIPHLFNPRPYQLDLLKAMDSGYKRAVVVWSRRAGKDKTLWNLIIKKALETRGTYYYFFPEYSQGRKAIWEGIAKNGVSFLDHIPETLAKRNANEMKLRLINGSIIQIIGTDKFDSVRGTNPIGCVFSEYAWQNPAAWDVVRPILRENGGWAVFNSTPYGENHFYKMWRRHNKDDSNWFTQMITADTALLPDGSPYITAEGIQEEIDDGMSESMVQQEFYCDFKADVGGFYYRKQLNEAEEEGRICSVPYDKTIPVETWWDVGWADDTAIWFTQTVGKEIHVIDYYVNNEESVDHYAKVLEDKGYLYDTHWLPHDGAAHSFDTGKTKQELLDDLVQGRVDVVPKIPRDEGIDALRMMFNRLWFDEEKTELGIDALSNYRRMYDSKLGRFKKEHVHDWASNGADALRQLAVGYRPPKSLRKKKKTSSYAASLKQYRDGQRTKSYMTA
jgi:phage terminase large subunit